ncbi:MAG: flagellar biosynthetic protein FliR [Solirubrobacteraceae bacterium]|nr:flagellar biosynthetic protein FliR [Solirubrobacteraceae bacterium]
MTPDALVQQAIGVQVAGFLLVLARISPLFLLAPLFSSKIIPRRVRGTIAVGLTVGIAPIALRGVDVPTDAVAYFELLVKEILIGTAFAYVLAALLAGLQAAGSLLDLQIGFAFGALVDPLTGHQGAILGQVYALFGVAILVVIGGDAVIIQGLARTFDLVPVDAFPQLQPMVMGVVRAFSDVLVAAIMVGAPVLLTLLLTDAAFGMVSRVVPQMNVFAVGFPTKVIVGLLFVAITLPFAAGWFADRLAPSVAQALRTLRVAG